MSNQRITRGDEGGFQGDAGAFWVGGTPSADRNGGLGFALFPVKELDERVFLGHL
jgi:hypothetical protein